MSALHTALPWHAEGPRIYTASKTLIATVSYFRDNSEETANVDLIVAACNERDDLVKALQQLYTFNASRMTNEELAEDPRFVRARAALAKAGAA